MPDLARLRSLEVRLRVLPLLTGRWDVSSLILVSPEIHLERLADGRVNWQVKGAPALFPGRPSAAELPAAERPSAAMAATGGPHIQAVTVRNGAVDYRVPGAEPRRIDLTEANFSAGSDAMRAFGMARVDGVEFGFDAQAGDSRRHPAGPGQPGGAARPWRR